MTTAPGDPLGCVHLGVHRIGGHHRLVEVQRFEKLSERGDLVGLAGHPLLGQHGAGGVVQVLQNPADGRLRRKSLALLQPQGLQVGTSQVGGVLPNRCQVATARQHSGHSQRQDREQAVARSASVAWVGDVPENLDQGLARQGVRGGG